MQNSVGTDNLKELKPLNQCLDDIETKEDKEAARKAMARYKLEGEKPTQFFCKMNKKIKCSAQFDNFVIKENDDTNIEHEKITLQTYGKKE